MSVLSDDFIDFEFPEPIPLTKVMKDFLENEVDEKYYIKSEKADKLIQQLIDNGTIGKHEEKSDKPNFMGSIYGRHDGYDGSVFGTNAPVKTITHSVGGVADILEEKSVEKKTCILSEIGTKFERETDVANTLMARDYKGFGHQRANGVIEWRK